MAHNSGLIRPLQNSERLRSLMTSYYRELDQASMTHNRKIAWCTSQGPVELLRAMGFLVYFPENHGVLLGTTRRSMDVMAAAHVRGYSPDICSYLTSDIGAFLREETPLAKSYGVSGLPRPDVLVYNNNQCRDVQEWFEFYGRTYQAPVHGIRTPRGVGEVTDEIIKSVSDQLRALSRSLELIAGERLSPESFYDSVEKSMGAGRLWKKVLGKAAHIPSPMTFFDACFHIGPAVTLRGTDEALKYYRHLLKELDSRIENGIGAVPGEKFRLYWEGMPIWGKLRFFAETMSRMDVCVVASTYGHSWVFDAFDPATPFESMARAYTELFTVRNEPFKEEFIIDLCKRFGVDGVIYHHSKTCLNCTNSLYGMPQRISERTGIPHLVIDGDLNDLRCFSQEQTLTNLEAFMEMLAERQGR